MSPRKLQVDWNTGSKHCPCGQPNHLDETHCVKCGFGLAGARSRQPFRMRRVYRFLILTTLAAYLIFYLSSPGIPTQQAIALAQSTQANIETVQARLLALTSAVDWRQILLSIETNSADLIFTLTTQIQTLEQQFTHWNERISQFELSLDQKKRKSSAAKTRPPPGTLLLFWPPRRLHLSQPPPGPTSAWCWMFTFRWRTSA